MKLIRIVLIASLAMAVYACFALCMAEPWFLALFAIAAIAIAGKRGSDTLWAHGTARWADAGDLRRAGMLGSSSQGMVIGRMEVPKPKLQAVLGLINPHVGASVACEAFLGLFRKSVEQPLVRLSNAVHTAVFAPTGVGKGVSCVIPFLLSCEDSCVVLDLKDGELAKITAEARRKMGHRIILLDPYKRVTDTPDTLNSLLSIDKTSPFAIDDCRETAAAMVDRKDENGDGIHFLDNAERAIAGIAALVVQFAEGEHKSLQAVCDIVSNPQKWLKAVELMSASDAWEGMLARMGGSLTHLKEREMASTMTTISRFLTFLSTPAIAASTRSSSFHPSELLTQKLTVYLVLPSERASTLSPLLRLWIGTLLRGVIRGGLQENNKVHFICDEANLLGKMNQIADALTIGRGFGIRMQLYYQDCGQLKKCWPDGADQTLLSNVSQVFFGVNDLPTAEYVSSRLGESTIVVNSGGTNSGSSFSTGADGGGGSTTRSKGANDNWAQQGRHLLKPSEVLSLSQRIAIAFTPGVAPVWTRLLRYYEEAPVPGRGQRLWAGVKMLAGSVFIFAFALMMAMGVTVFASEKQQERKVKATEPFWFR